MLILSISNGAGHTRAAEVIASAIRAARPEMKVLVVDVADYMTRLARFTHLTLYLWLVRFAPRVWERIDNYQKKQNTTSPEWYYRRGCRRLFDFVRELQPVALVATEVGCCEIAALIKRELLNETVPLVAVNTCYEGDRAWVREEVNLYCAATEEVRAEFIAQDAPPERIRVWGVPLEPELTHSRSEEEHEEVCRRLRLAPRLPIVLVAGGSCGLGPLEEIVRRLLSLQRPGLQLVVLTGRNERLRHRLEKLQKQKENGARLRVLRWTTEVARLMRSADLLVSKMGNTFDEALAAELPLVGLTPPPGSERVQHKLLDELGTGRAVGTIEEVVEAVSDLILHKNKLERLRENARAHKKTEAAPLIARWIVERIAPHEKTRSATSQMMSSAAIACELIGENF